MAGGRGDLAFVADIGSYEHDSPTVAVCTCGCFQEGTAFDDDISVSGSSGKRCGYESRGAVIAAWDIEAREQELGVFVVKEAIFYEVVVDREGRGDEGARVDLGTGAEDDAVLVEDVDLALGVDFATDFGGFGGGVEDFVEGDPFT